MGASPMDAQPTSVYTGVVGTDGVWMAQLVMDGETITQGPFETEVEAAQAYDRWAFTDGDCSQLCRAVSYVCLRSIQRICLRDMVVIPLRFALLIC